MNKTILKNSLWMMSEKIVSIFGLIFVTSFVAKYIGPESFGKLNFSMAIFAVIKTLSLWGTDTIISKRLNKKSSSGVRLLLYSKRVRESVFWIVSFPVIIYTYFYSDRLEFIFTCAVCLSTMFLSKDIFSVYNEAKLESFRNVISNVIGLTISLAVRYLLVYYKQKPELLAIPIVLVSMLPYLIRLYLFRNDNINKVIINSTRNIDKKRYNKYIIKAGLGLVLSAIAVTIYVNISSIILGKVISKSALGIYAVALSLGGAWCFINLSFLASYTPKLYKAENDTEAQRVAATVSRIMIFNSVVYASIFYCVGNQFIVKLYGEKFIEAFPITFIVILSTLLSNVGQIYSRLLFKENAFKFNMYKTIFTTFCGIILAFIFIIWFKTYGAALNSLVVEFLSLTIFNYFYKNGYIFKAQLKIFHRSI